MIDAAKKIFDTIGLNINFRNFALFFYIAK